MQTAALPSTFYRVTGKALIFDDQHRLLVVGKGDEWEMPGGGWEHDETFEECMQREVQEELGVVVSYISTPQFIYRGKSVHGWYAVRIVVTASIENHAFVYGDGMTQAKFVARDAFLALQFGSSEEGILDHVDQIWSTNSTE